MCKIDWNSVLEEEERGGKNNGFGYSKWNVKKLSLVCVLRLLFSFLFFMVTLFDRYLQKFNEIHISKFALVERPCKILLVRGNLKCISVSIPVHSFPLY